MTITGPKTENDHEESLDKLARSTWGLMSEGTKITPEHHQIVRTGYR